MSFSREPLTLLSMLAVFAGLSAWRRWPVPIALVAAAWVGAALGGYYFPLRHLVEGSFTYLDTVLIITAAMVFMRFLADSGLIGAVGRQVVTRFGKVPALLLPLLMLIVMLPGMLTGSSTASVLTTGAMVASVLIGMGVSRERAGAFVALGGILGMVAPPVNIPAMLIGGGIDMPYVGFGVPLALASFPLAIILSWALGRPEPAVPRPPALSRAEAAAANDLTAATEAETAVTEGESLPGAWRAYLPLAVVAVLMLGVKIWPGKFPDLGLPLIFAAGAVIALAVAPRFDVKGSLYRAADEALPVLGILTAVGMFIQVMTLTGARGFLVALMLGVPRWALYAGVALSIPLFGAISAYGSASVLGVPFLLALLGRNEIVTTAGLSLLSGLGDLMLPAALAATLAARVAGVEDRLKVLRLCIIPAGAGIAVALGLIAFAPQLGKLLF